jgi:group I intron endonuclease
MTDELNDLIDIDCDSNYQLPITMSKLSFEDEFPLENRGEIYIATNTETGKSYVGQAVSCLSSGNNWGTKKRWNKHLSNARTGNHDCHLLENSIAKHGPDVWELRVLEYCQMSKLNELEDKYVKIHNTLSPNGYNLMTGGGNGRKHHQSTRDKMSATRTGKIFSEETKERMSEALMGRTFSDETKAKMSQSAKNKIVTLATRLKMSVVNSGRILELFKELNLNEFNKSICYCKTQSSEGFCIRCPGMKRFTTTSVKKTMNEKYQECLDFLGISELKIN